MNSNAIVFSAEFRARGYSEEELAELRKLIAPLAAVRLRGLHLPEAGGAAELSIVIEFVGRSLAEGAIAWIGGSTLKHVVGSLVGWLRRKNDAGPFGHELKRLTISADDVDVHFVPHRGVEDPDQVLEESAVARLPEALESVWAALPAELLSQEKIQFVQVPVICFSPSEKEFDASRQGNPTRQWRVGRQAPFATDIFDSETREFLPLPRS